jgi:hypothetical protein
VEFTVGGGGRYVLVSIQRLLSLSMVLRQCQAAKALEPKMELLTNIIAGTRSQLYLNHVAFASTPPSPTHPHHPHPVYPSCTLFSHAALAVYTF